MRLRSLPVRGAWIEIFFFGRGCLIFQSLPVRGAWIEIFISFISFLFIQSLPVRGAWIEMPGKRDVIRRALEVAPRAGSVD